MAPVLRHGAPKGKDVIPGARGCERGVVGAVLTHQTILRKSSCEQPMARRRRMFKQLSNVKTENVGHTGGNYLLYKIDKQQASFTSAYLDKVRIAYHLDITDASTERPNDVGVTFYLSTSDSAVSSAYLVSATASNGYGGTITLDAKRSIRDEEEASTRGDGALFVWC